MTETHMQIRSGQGDQPPRFAEGLHPGIELAHHFGGGVYAKQTSIPAGVVLTQHVHKHDHLSVLASGIASVSVDGCDTEHVGPACLVIAAGKAHSVHALTDVVWYCIHATDETDADRVDEALIA